jgi:hypothetical protein
MGWTAFKLHCPTLRLSSARDVMCCSSAGSLSRKYDLPEIAQKVLKRQCQPWILELYAACLMFWLFCRARPYLPVLAAIF